MDEYGNIKPGQFKNDPLSLAMASVPVFPPRPMPGTANPFPNPPMPSAYSFNMDGSLGHVPGLYNPPPPHHPNTTKLNSRPPDNETRQMGHSFSKPPSMAYHNFSPLNSCNIVTTNGFFNLNAPSDMSKHSFEDVLNSPPNFNSDPSMSAAQVMPPKTQYHEPPSSHSVMTDISVTHYSQEPINSYVPSLNPISHETHMVEPKKRSKSQKTQSKPTTVNSITLVSNVDLGVMPNVELHNKTVSDEDVIQNGVVEMAPNTDMLSKLYSGKNVYKCGFCDLRVSSNEALLGHLNTHTNLLPYHCGICGVAFIEGSQLMKHVQHSHAVKAPYACGICTSAFHQNEELKEHMDIHDKADNLDGVTNKTKLPPLPAVTTDKKKAYGKVDGNMKEEETELDGEDEDDDGSENVDPSNLRLNPANNTIIIGKDTNFSMRKGPSKIVMDDVDLNSVCTIIVEPSSAGGIRKKHLFKCNYCEKVCKDKGSLVSHVRTHTKGRPYECNICMAKFKQYAHLSDHIMTKHTKERPFVCDRCAKTFNRKSHLQDHIRLRHTEDKLYHCPECSATFQKRTEFSEHKKSHGKRPKYQCNMCPRQFRNVTDYERHIRSHTKEKRFECEVCHLTFGLLANAKKHMIKHNEERPYKCEVCPKAYHFEHDFKRHKLTHLKKKPFPCPDCYKSFKNALLLKKHAKETHMKSEEDPTKKPFKCTTCYKRFRIQWDLDRHRKIHAKKKPFPCLYCYKTYGSEAMLLKHAKVHEGQDLPMYDHSKDLIEESELDEKPKKRGRKPRLSVESNDGSQDQGDESEIEKPKKKGRPLKRKRESHNQVNQAPKRRGRPPKHKNDSDSDEKVIPSIKITLKRKNLRKRKFSCPLCNKAFMSKAMLKRHSRVHEEEATEDESMSDNESTNDNISIYKTAKATSSLKRYKKAAVVKKKKKVIAKKNMKNDDTTCDDDTTRDEETTRGGDTTRDGNDTRDDETTRENTSAYINDESSTPAFASVSNDKAKQGKSGEESAHFSQVTIGNQDEDSVVPNRDAPRSNTPKKEIVFNWSVVAGDEDDRKPNIPQTNGQLTTAQNANQEISQVDASSFFQQGD